jgi:hypothetical protein
MPQDDPTAEVKRKAREYSVRTGPLSQPYGPPIEPYSDWTRYDPDERMLRLPVDMANVVARQEAQKAMRKLPPRGRKRVPRRD